MKKTMIAAVVATGLGTAVAAGQAAATPVPLDSQMSSTTIETKATAPLNPVSAALQSVADGLSFIGGQDLPGQCNIPTGC
ncbi:hypothetical protein ACWIGI_31975 [Nocardia sp. NPDC055321]